MSVRLGIIAAAIIIGSTACVAQEGPVVLVAYYSIGGHTEAMARATADGARSVEGVEVRLKKIGETGMDDILDAGAIIIGSPVYNANVAPAVQEFINGWPFEGAPLKNKIGAAVVTGGGISVGEEETQLSILRSMLVFGMVVVGGPDWRSAFGASAVTGEEPFTDAGSELVKKQFLDKASALGRRVAELAVLLHDGAMTPEESPKGRSGSVSTHEGTGPPIDLITILTDRAQELSRFYRDVVGLIPEQETDDYIEFHNAGIRFAVCSRRIMADATGHSSFLTPPAGQSFELAFRLESPHIVDQEYNRLVQNGATAIKPPATMPWGQRTAFLADPDGNIFELFADLPKSTTQQD